MSHNPRQQRAPIERTVPPTHSATVAQTKAPHRATLTKSNALPPHSATVIQAKAPHRAATVERRGGRTLQRMDPAPNVAPPQHTTLKLLMAGSGHVHWPGKTPDDWESGKVAEGQKFFVLKEATTKNIMISGPDIDITGTGFFNYGDNSIEQCYAFAEAHCKHFVQFCPNGLIQIQAHSRNAVAAALLCCYLSRTHPAMAFEAVLFDPVPGPGWGALDEDRPWRGPISTCIKWIGTGWVSGYWKIDVPRSANHKIVLVYSTAVAMADGFQPALICGANSLIITGTGHDAGSGSGFTTGGQIVLGVDLVKLPRGIFCDHVDPWNVVAGTAPLLHPLTLEVGSYLSKFPSQIYSPGKTSERDQVIKAAATDVAASPGRG